MRAEIQRVSEDIFERDLRAGRYNECFLSPLTAVNSQKAEEVRKVEADLAGKKPESEESEEEYEYYYEK